ncbi:MAG: glycosyltransferase [Lachnospiraceae bacterium]|nr:glycosyltransferase [Lachnospiraceae bacterium]
MKKLLLVNVVCGVRSTGRIVSGIADEYQAKGYQVRIAYGRVGIPESEKDRAVRIGTDRDARIHGLLTRAFDLHCFGSRRATRKFLAWASSYDPDILWLHNIHGYYLHVGELFAWIRQRPQMEVRWTLHDCWAFTGHCAHFTATGCEKWRSGCRGRCPEKHSYPVCYLFSRVEKNYAEKKALFQGLPRMTLITPSQWLADTVKQSYLAEYPVEVMHTKIDREVFKPTGGFDREAYHLQDKKIVLGVTVTWTKRKGWDDLLALAEQLPEPYRLVLVGVTAKQQEALPENITGIGRTNDQKELAALYSAAECLVNPTYEDTYPTVNLEAEACGTRVIAYDVGGCRETLEREDSVVIPAGDTEKLLEAIVH